MTVGNLSLILKSGGSTIGNDIVSIAFNTLGLIYFACDIDINQSWLPNNKFLCSLIMKEMKI